MLQVGLGTDYDARNLLDTTEVYDFVVDDLNHLEGASRGDGIDKDETMDANSMFGVKY